MLKKVLRKWDGPSINLMVPSDDDSLTTFKFRMKDENFSFYYFANIWTRINISALNEPPNQTAMEIIFKLQIALDSSQRLSFSLRLRRQCDWVFIHIIAFVKRQWQICVYAKLKRISNWTLFVLSKHSQKEKKLLFENSYSANCLVLDISNIEHFVKQSVARI